MKTKYAMLAALLVAAGCATSGIPPDPKEKRPMTTHRATGPFEITMVPPSLPYDTVGDVVLGRMTINKVLHGDLEGTSVVEMLTSMNGSVQGSGAYVAIERIVGTLKDETGNVRSGSFVLQHSGTMSKGRQNLTVTIVPDSGTGELTGIAGTLKIDIVEGKHAYTMDYTIGSSDDALMSHVFVL